MTYDPCSSCELCKSRTRIVWGQGPVDTGLCLIGEAPGEEEDASGRPFVGKTGRELDGCYLTRFAHAPRDMWYVTNMVKCRPPHNRDPKREEIAACSRHLQSELDMVRPRIIGALGRVASSYLLGKDVDMEMLHGIPQRGANDVIILPMYHPAAGLHDPSKMIAIQRDFEMLGQVVRGDARPEMWRDGIEHTDYVTGGSYAVKERMDLDILAVDTETYVDGRLFSTQWCGHAGSAVFMQYGRERRGTLETALLVMHNALFDLPLLRGWCDRIDSKIMDTMVMAYVLQDEPQGLKTLAYRHCGMQMSTFAELVERPQHERSYKYLMEAMNHPWPEPKQILVWDGDTPRLKKPWPMSRKAASILRAMPTMPGSEAYRRWQKIPLEEGRGLVESTMGPMPIAGIEHVPIKDAVHYACRDADATFRIFPKLWKRVKDQGLEAAFWIDMGIVDMVIDMMEYGMPTQPHKFRTLAAEFALHADEVESDISRLVGHYVNPASSKQVAELLFKTLRLRSKKKSKKTGEDSTDQKYLGQLKHAAVDKILEWRKYKKLQTTYAEALPRLVDSIGRIHPQIKTTRTSTGRLATSNPNLQNIPVRSREGRMIRDCFAASDGCVFLGLDYQQIELKVLAHESGDPIMTDTFNTGKDIHERTACEVFGLTPDRVRPYEHRRPAKMVNFGIPYGITADGLHDNLAREGADLDVWSVDRCQEFIDEWFRVYHGVLAYMKQQETCARRFGFVRDLFGRLRRIPGVYSTVKSVVSGAAREAGNMPIQAGAQEIMKIAMADLVPVYRKWRAEGRIVRPIMQIHDELLWEVEEPMLHEVYAVCKIIMENAVVLSVPIKVDGKVGPVWGHMEDLGHDQ